MRRFASAVSALAMLIAGAFAIGFLVEESAHADLDPKGCSNQTTQVLTTRQERIRMVIPRNWCGSDHPGYPGVLVSITPMLRTAPPGEILLTAEPFTRELYCSWPVACRNQASNTAKYACALREKLAASRMRVGPAQLGPRENETNGLPSMWFEFDDNRRFLRQAVAVTADRAYSLVLSAPSIDARTSHVRAFDSALRTLQLLEAPAEPGDAGVPVDNDAKPPPSDGGITPPPPSAPVQRQSPIGPCPR